MAFAVAPLLLLLRAFFDLAPVLDAGGIGDVGKGTGGFTSSDFLNRWSKTSISTLRLLDGNRRTVLWGTMATELLVGFPLPSRIEPRRDGEPFEDGDPNGGGDDVVCCIRDRESGSVGSEIAIELLLTLLLVLSKELTGGN